MAVYAGPVQELIDELGRLPGIGPKSAQRIAFHLLKLSRVDASRLANAIVEAKDRVTFCARCFNIAEGAGDSAALCTICAPARARTRAVTITRRRAREAISRGVTVPGARCQVPRARQGQPSHRK